MAVPLLIRFGRPATGEIPKVPGRYDFDAGLRVIDAEGGPVPVISRVAHLDLATKTDHIRERDDEEICLASITKTGVPREAEDTDGDVAGVADADTTLDREMIALLTKTLHAREADDEPPP